MSGLIPSGLLQAWCLAVMWLVWRFRLRNATQAQPPGLMLFVGFHSVVLLFAAGMAAEDSRNWERWARLPRTTTVEQLARLANQQQTLLIARAPEGFLIEYDADDGHAWADASMSLELEDGTTTLEPVIPAERVGWHSSYSTVTRSRSWLEEGDPVVAAVTIRHGTTLGGRRVVWGEPHLVLRGGAEAFAAEAGVRERRLVPRLVTWAALLEAALAATLPLASVLLLGWRRATGREGNASGQAPPAVGNGSVDRKNEPFWERFLVRPPNLPTAFGVASLLAIPLLLLTVVVGQALVGRLDAETPSTAGREGAAEPASGPGLPGGRGLLEDELDLLEAADPEAPEPGGGQDAQAGKQIDDGARRDTGGDRDPAEGPPHAGAARRQ